MRIEDSLRRIANLPDALRLFEHRCTADMVRIYLERCDQLLAEPSSRDFIPLVELACSVAERLRDSEQMAQAFAVLGAAYRRTGRQGLAHEAFARGLALTSPKGLARADVLQRRAVLLADQGEFPAATAEVDQAVKARRVLSRFRFRECETLPFALVFRGYVYNKAGNLTESLSSYAEALGLANRYTPRTYIAALYNFLDLQEYVAVSPDESGKLIKKIKEALRTLSRRQVFYRSKLEWALALQLFRLGSSRKAEKILSRIRPRLLSLDVREFLCVSLDLADVCRFHEDEIGLATVLKEMAAAVTPRDCLGLQIESALIQAAAAGDSAVAIVSVREAVGGRIRFYPAPTYPPGRMCGPPSSP